MYGSSRSQVTTPRKRKSVSGSTVDDERDPVGSSSEESDVNVDT